MDMIHPSQLTKEAGFEEGVVVEVVDTNLRKSLHYFKSVGDADGLPFVCLNDWNPALVIIDSIQPLTGPMAIWNFAPEWANYFIKRHDMKRSAFVAQLCCYMLHGPHAERYRNDWSERPWWAK